MHNCNTLSCTKSYVTSHWLFKLFAAVMLGLIFVMTFSCSTQPLLVKSHSSLMSFSVMGDVPRSETEKIILQKQIEQHNQLSLSQFVFHVGDIKSGDAPCDEDNYAVVAEYLKHLTVPVFIVPGDNEWNDCESPDQAWNFWNKYFKAFDQNWKLPFDVQRQQDYPVNGAFVKNDVLFIMLNLVGGRIHNQIKWDEMQQNAVDWIDRQFQQKEVVASVILAQAKPDHKHKLFMDQFLPLVEVFKRPVLLIHGDGHRWLYDDPWLVPNLIRVQVDKGGIADQLQVTIFGNTTKKFTFDRNPFKVID